MSQLGISDRSAIVAGAVALMVALLCLRTRLGFREWPRVAAVWIATSLALRAIGPLVAVGEYDDYDLYLHAVAHPPLPVPRPLYEWLLERGADFTALFPLHSALAGALPALAYVVARRAQGGVRDATTAAVLVALSGSVLVYGSGVTDTVPFAVATVLTALLVDGALEPRPRAGAFTRFLLAGCAGVTTLVAATCRAEGCFAIALVPIATIIQVVAYGRPLPRSLMVTLAWATPLVFGHRLIANEAHDIASRVVGYGQRYPLWIPVAACIAVAPAVYAFARRRTTAVRVASYGLAVLLALLEMRWLCANAFGVWAAGSVFAVRRRVVPLATLLFVGFYTVLYAGLVDAFRHQLSLLPFVVPLSLAGYQTLAAAYPRATRSALRIGAGGVLVGAAVMLVGYSTSPKQTEFRALVRARPHDDVVYHFPYASFGAEPQSPLRAILPATWSIREVRPPDGCPPTLFRALALLHAGCLEDYATRRSCSRALENAPDDWVVRAAAIARVVPASAVRGRFGPLPQVLQTDNTPVLWFTPYWSRELSLPFRLAHDVTTWGLPAFDLLRPIGLVFDLRQDARRSAGPLTRVRFRPGGQARAECERIAARPEGVALQAWIGAVSSAILEGSSLPRENRP